MRGFGRNAAWSFLSAAAFMFVLGGCAAPETVSRDIHVKRGVTLEDDLIHFYGAPSQRIIRGDSEYFVYNARTMNITSADGSSCRGTPVFIFSYDTKKLSDLKCRENIPAEDLSSKAGDSIVVGVTDSGNTPMYDVSAPETDAADGDAPALAPAAGITGAEALSPEGAAVPVEDLSAEGSGSGAQDSAGSALSGTEGVAGESAQDGGIAGGSGSAGDGPDVSAGASGSESDGDEIPLAGDDGEMQIINR